jgi:hypothetical protein
MSSACWEKKKKNKKEREMAQGLFPTTEFVLLAVLPGIFTVVRCN